MSKGAIPNNGDAFIADVINQKNISMNTNQSLSSLSVIIQDVDEFQIASAEAEAEISDC